MAAGTQAPPESGRKEEFEEEAGPAVGDMPPNPPEDTSPPPLEAIVVTGTEQRGLFQAGGKAPTSAVLTLTGGKAELAQGTTLRKGQIISGSFVAVVREVGQKDKVDGSTQLVVDCVEKIGAKVTDLRIDDTGGGEG